MNILGIDWGEKRIGLAFADDLKIPVPLKPAIQKSLKQRMDFIKKTIEEKKIEFIVVGYPLNMNGSAGEKAKQVDNFINKLKKRFNLPLIKIDERLTTQNVEKDLKLIGKKIDKKSGEIDSRSACLIVSSYFEI